MRIDIGAKVRTQEGDEVGSVERVILSPTTRDVSALVVRRGPPVAPDVVVPISLVQRADEREVRLRIGRDRVRDLPTFVDRHYVAEAPEAGAPLPYAPGSVLFPLQPPYGIPGVPGPFESPEKEREAAPLELDISQGMEVRTVDGPIGVVEEVRTDPLADRVSEIMVRREGGRKREVVVPIEFVAEIAPDHVKLSLTNQQVEELPLPTTDRYLTVEGRKGRRGKR